MRLRLATTLERPVGAVPFRVKAVLLGTLLMHVGWQAITPQPAAHASALGKPLAVDSLRVASLGEPLAFSHALTLYLQAFDNQPGISIPYQALDYATVLGWLGAALELDPRSEYPLVMAAYLYAQVPDERKQRLMLDFVHREFLRDPDRRWRLLAHAAIVAKHRLKDMALALRYADDITHHAGAALNWARQMRIFILEDMGEREAAAILLGGLLANGEVTDPSEIRFLTERLDKLKSAEKSSGPSEFR